VPIPEEVEEETSYEKTMIAGIVPITFGVGLILDMCVETYLGMGDNGMPKLEIKPLVQVGAEAKGGVGFDLEGFIEVWAGVKLEIIFAAITIPIAWGVSVDIVIANDRSAPPKLKPVLKLAIGERVALELEFLGGAMGLFAEINFGPFGFEWALELFAWSGITVTKTLSERTVWETDVDFQFDPGLSLSAGGSGQVCDGVCQ